MKLSVDSPEGVALGWNLILADLLAKGQLVPLAEPIVSEGSYHILVSDRGRTSGAASGFITWIQSIFPRRFAKNAVMSAGRGALT